MFKKHVFGWLFGLLLTSFTTYVLLDTFVIVRSYAVAETHSISTIETERAAADDTVSTETSWITTDDPDKQDTNSSVGMNETETEQAAVSPYISTAKNQSVSAYQDDNIIVSISQYRIEDTTVYVADVQLSDAKYLQTAFASNIYGRNVTDTTSSIADSVQAVLAVNGDFYGTQQAGYVIRNGVLYRSAAKKNAEDLVIYTDGSFGIINESEITAEQLLTHGAWNVLSFGPALVQNSEVSVSVNDEVGRAKASNPRTAVAIVDDLHYLFVVSDGRTTESEGLSLYQLATFLKTLGATTAYNLDGGGSSTMVFLGTVINNPTTNGNKTKERSVSDIVYIGV